ncbi:hypothetical protein [Mucilaginibacter auburnensis]|uniref:Uncharacterized protein n=1 Tax=Mucilaginibacter auburnensis TaxID=1457233 RepID=A0A2H9VRD8_9SPHI|nr:hypothetical protein [Mucilaginibacter auburnensis]PJJ83390.1 hypothetical protein CLV57_0372 [Mucilaginibacter auburnensis]
MKPLHPYLRIASNLYRASALLTVLAYFLADVTAMVPEMLMIAFMLIAAYLIRAGIKWLKWLLLAWELYNLPAFITLLKTPWKDNPSIFALLIFIEVLQIAALVFLFLSRKDDDDTDWEDEGEDEPAKPRAE